MSPTVAMLGAATIVGISTGQILFKLAAQNASLADILRSPAFWTAIPLYGVVTLIWVLLLREIELSRAYPILAAATFILVPAASAVVFGEKIGLNYVVGTALIVAGIVMTVRA